MSLWLNKIPPELEIRLFISSVFTGMEAEREHLSRFIFPNIRKYCVELGISFTEIDLRWGVTDDERREGRIIELCLMEIDRCRPYFMFIGGRRYGWVAPEAADILRRAEFTHLEQYADRSISELEVRHAILNAPRAAVPVKGLVYLQGSEYSQSPTSDIENPIDVARQEALADELRHAAYRLRESYVSVDDFGQLVLGDLKCLADEMKASAETVNLRPSAMTQAGFVRDLTRRYVARSEEERSLTHSVWRGNRLILIEGPQGSGKSAVLANWALSRSRLSGGRRPGLWRRFWASLRGAPLPPDNEILVCHFVEAGAVGDWCTSMRPLLEDLNELCSSDSEIPSTPTAMATAIRERLVALAARNHVLLVVDSVDGAYLDQQNIDVDWLPDPRPSRLSVIVSAANPGVRTALIRAGARTLTLTPLPMNTRRELSRLFLNQYGRRLADAPMSKIISGPSSGAPLYLSVLLEEIRAIPRHEDLHMMIDILTRAPDLRVLYMQMFSRWEGLFERQRSGLVGEALSMLALARRGLSENDLMTLLGSGRRLPAHIWSPLAIALEPHILRISGQLSIGHQALRAAILDRYCPTVQIAAPYRRRMVGYLAECPISPRIMDELPWQLVQLTAWQELAELLTDTTFFPALWRHDAFALKTYWAILVRNGWDIADHLAEAVADGSASPEAALATVTLLIDAGSSTQALAVAENLVTRLKMARNREWLAPARAVLAEAELSCGHNDGALTILTEQEAFYRAAGDRRNLCGTLGNLAIACRRLGRPDAAMRYHREEERLCRELDIPVALGICLGNQGIILSDRGDVDKALALFEEQSQLCRRHADVRGLIASLGNRAVLLRKRGKVPQAMTLHREEETLCRQVGDRAGLAVCLGNLAEVLLDSGDNDAAVTAAEEQEILAKRLNDGRSLVIANLVQAAAFHNLGRRNAAMEMLERAEVVAITGDTHDGLRRRLADAAAKIRGVTPPDNTD